MKIDNYNIIRVFQNKQLTSTEKLIMIDFIIDIGDITKENCLTRLSNEEISKHINCSKTCVSQNLSSLIKKGYLEMINFDGRSRTLRIKKI